MSLLVPHTPLIFLPPPEVRDFEIVTVPSPGKAILPQFFVPPPFSMTQDRLCRRTIFPTLFRVLYPIFSFAFFLNETGFKVLFFFFGAVA